MRWYVLPNTSTDSKLTRLSETDPLVGFGRCERPSNNLRRRHELIDHPPPLNLGRQTKWRSTADGGRLVLEWVNNRSASAGD